VCSHPDGARCENAGRHPRTPAKACGYLDDHGEAIMKKEIESGLQAGTRNPRTRSPRTSGLVM